MPTNNAEPRVMLSGVPSERSGPGSAASRPWIERGFSPGPSHRQSGAGRRRDDLVRALAMKYSGTKGRETAREIYRKLSLYETATSPSRRVTKISTSG
jgi:hypothetical protein